MSYQLLARLGVTVVPLDRWPGPRTPSDARRPTPFSSTLSSTVAVLAAELSAIDATDVRLGLDLQPGQIRIDGIPRADARCDDPGVLLAFDSSKGPLRFASDRYESRGWRSSGPGWQENLRAIALGLEALRKVDRYGITSDGQQYRGFAELPSGIPMSSPTHMTREVAIETIRRGAGDPGWLPMHVAAIDSGFRAAARHLHPDAGGDPAEFARLTAARDLLLRAARQEP